MLERAAGMYVPLAIGELERCLKLGLAGVEIGSNINGKPIGHPDLEPFFAAAASMIIFSSLNAGIPAGMGLPGLATQVARPLGPSTISNSTA